MLNRSMLEWLLMVSSLMLLVYYATKRKAPFERNAHADFFYQMQRSKHAGCGCKICKWIWISMNDISRRNFINVAGIGLGAAFLPSFLDGNQITGKYSPSWYLYVQSSRCRTRHNAEAQLHVARLAGIDSLVFCVHEDGAHYDSAFYSRCPDIELGFDPLGFLSQRGSELGINIYAWIAPGVECHQFNSDWDIAGKYGAPPTLHWLDFSIPEARERVKEIALDIIGKSC